jgi:hypothetical protein
LAFFNRHIQAVKDFVGEENLLVYDVRKGWDPLCDFLEMPVPNKPFPRLNRQEGVRDLVTRIFKFG